MDFKESKEKKRYKKLINTKEKIIHKIDTPF
jgi:hypothetical protein